MGKNKERLNEHNIDLSAILSSIQNLPPAGGEDLQSTAETQTTEVSNLVRMVARKVSDHKGEGEYVWKKLTEQNGTCINFVVNSDVTAYPDGGMQDGYWYERANEGVSGIAYGEVVVSGYTTKSITVNHNLGVTPRAAFLIPYSNLLTSGYVWFAQKIGSVNKNLYGSLSESGVVTVDASIAKFEAKNATAIYPQTYLWVVLE